MSVYWNRPGMQLTPDGEFQQGVAFTSAAIIREGLENVAAATIRQGKMVAEGLHDTARTSERNTEAKLHQGRVIECQNQAIKREELVFQQHSLNGKKLRLSGEALLIFLCLFDVYYADDPVYVEDFIEGHQDLDEERYTKALEEYEAIKKIANNKGRKPDHWKPTWSFQSSIINLDVCYSNIGNEEGNLRDRALFSAKVDELKQQEEYERKHRLEPLYEDAIFAPVWHDGKRYSRPLQHFYQKYYFNIDDTIVTIGRDRINREDIKVKLGDIHATVFESLGVIRLSTSDAVYACEFETDDVPRYTTLRDIIDSYRIVIDTPEGEYDSCVGYECVARQQRDVK